MGELHFADNETPSGAMDGVNLKFVLAHAPNPPASLVLFHNGVLKLPDVEYSLQGNTITYRGDQPPNGNEGDWLRAWYRY
jgi:hypothetical protein